MIVKKCRKCGREFADFSMFGQQSTCDTCSENIAWSTKYSSDKVQQAQGQQEKA